MIRSILKNRKHTVLVFVAIIFFCSYFYLHATEAIEDIRNHSSHSIISNQPDEMAHYFFIRELVFNHSFGALDFLTGAAKNQIHPRSMTVIQERLQPIGFPFFIVLISFVTLIPTIVFGSSMFNLLAISLVPVLAIGSNFLLYGIVRRMWNERMALISSILLFLLPPWWYWSSHPFQHVIPFIFFLILALYSLLRIKDGIDEKEKKWLSVLSGLGISIALAIRPNEVVWVLCIFLYLVYTMRSVISKKIISAWIASAMLVLILFFVIQDAFYGSLFASGYVKPLSTGEAGSALTGGHGVSFIRAFLFPFGIHIEAALKTAYRYFFVLFNPWTLWTLVSVMFIVFRGEKIIRRYFAIWAFVSLYIIVWYGSWNFSDNLLGVPSIGSSQIRYFMPIYVGMIPLIAYFADRVLILISRKKQIAAIVVSTLLFILSSHNAVYLSFPEGLTRVKGTLHSYRDWQGTIYARVPENGVVVTRYADKYIFPGRKVIIRTSEEIAWVEAVKKLSELKLEIWWHDLKLSPEELSNVDELLSVQGLKLGEVEDSWNDLELRRVVEK